jgi:hypothetical protein
MKRDETINYDMNWIRIPGCRSDVHKEFTVCYRVIKCKKTGHITNSTVIRIYKTYKILIS